MSKTVFDDTKVTDHHAIIPTEVPPSQNLSKEEKLVYDLVARRFIAVFYPECKISNTLVEGKVGTIPFKANGKQILEPGWRIVYAKDKKESSEKIKRKNKISPNLKLVKVVNIFRLFIREKHLLQNLIPKLHCCGLWKLQESRLKMKNCAN